MSTIFKDVLQAFSLSSDDSLNMQTSSIITDILEGWNNTPGIEAPMIDRGGADGSRRGSRWRSKERYMTIGGAVYGAASRAATEDLRQRLFTLFNTDSDVLLMRGPKDGSYPARYMYVSVYDVIVCEDVTEDGFRFTIPVVALDPVKYGDVFSGLEAAAFAGERLYRTYNLTTAFSYNNGGAQTVQAEQITRKNLITSPRAELSTSAWEGYAGGSGPFAVSADTSRVAHPEYNGPAAFTISWSDSNGEPPRIRPKYANGVVVTPAANQVIEVRAQMIYADVNNTMPNGVLMEIGINEYNSAGTLIGTAEFAYGKIRTYANRLETLKITAPLQAATARVVPSFRMGDGFPGAQSFNGAGQLWVMEPIVVLQNTADPLNSYWDGETYQDRGRFHRWDGTVNASPSSEFLPAREDPGHYFRNYSQPVPGDRPSSVTVVNAGNASSRRITFRIHGPLPTNQWEVVNETTGQAFFLDFPLTSNEGYIEIDCFEETVRYGDNDLSNLFYGDWIRFAPGPNTFRLSTGQAAPGAYMEVITRSSWR